MRKVEIGSHEVEMYDGIEELPVVRFHRYNKMLLVDAGIGSGIADFDRHVQKAVLYVQGNEPEKAATELENLRQNVYFIQQGLSPQNLAFAALVAAVDGEPCNDLSDAGLARVVEALSDAKQSELAARLEAVKKKMDEELSLYFPKMADDALMKEYNDRARAYALAILRAVSEGGATEEDEAEIGRMEGELATFFDPQPFAGSGSVEIKCDKQFEAMCLLVSQHLHAVPKRMAVLEFYHALEYIEEENRRMKKKTK